MKKEYDFSKMKGERNPYYKILKKQITIKLDVDVISYFKNLAKETNISYQNLINFYLKDCLSHKRRPTILWPR